MELFKYGLDLGLFLFFFIADFTGHRMQLENASLRLIVCSKVTVLVFILVSFWVVLV